jgi:hypothetical protein
MTKVRGLCHSWEGKRLRAHKVADFKQGGFARSRSMGYRIYMVVLLEPFEVINIGNLNVGSFEFSKLRRIKQPKKGKGWYEPVELYIDPIPHPFRASIGGLNGY